MTGTFLARRSTELERLDTEPYGFEEFQEYLHGLEHINRWVLTYRPTLKWLEKALAALAPGRRISILDVGSGNGDMLRRIWTWGLGRGLDLDLLGIDLNPWSRKSAELATPPGAPIRFETADVLDFTPPDPVDFIISSHLTHHLTDEQNVRFLRWMEAQARHGWFINDLHRHALPYHAVKYAIPLVSRNPSIRHDAPLSVARAFTSADWRGLLDAAGIPAGQTRLAWFFPFRYCVGRSKP